jgi:hypothetical protein
LSSRFLALIVAAMAVHDTRHGIRSTMFFDGHLLRVAMRSPSTTHRLTPV